MSVSTVLGWMVCGLIVGLVARLLFPGRLSMGLLTTVALGIAGAVVGGFLYSFIEAGPSDPLSLSANAGRSWFVAMLGAALVLWGYVSLYPKRWWQ
jgi:uncharacterized membrane protein YeaQ/YmgE (transglycosylase-associated protein family)